MLIPAAYTVSLLVRAVTVGKRTSSGVALIWMDRCYGLPIAYTKCSVRKKMCPSEIAGELKV